ncbi:thermonuclease family protein [Acidihalobacter ferrooxydans]|uniref:thermonuclease family protein n=1 Tax=Acidihalobacter ferrooxydans TaxID=1765967 RepID=UPI0018DBC5B6|nr:thermonuclease family protein [Acidihalobacter ferrooxydans]
MGALFSFGAAHADCPSGRVDAQAHVAYVIDGDTVILADGRHVRLIGLDTPELGHGGKPSQPYARRARQALVALLASSHDTVELRYGEDRRDHYGRTLAHLFLPNGTSVTAALLRDGLATALVVPPDLWDSACYADAEAAARSRHLGIWSLPRYQPIASRALPADAQGFHIVRGRVVHVGRSRNAQWIDLDGGVALRIARRNLKYFHNVDFSALRGRHITVRGWVHTWKKGDRVIAVRYPAALEIGH